MVHKNKEASVLSKKSHKIYYAKHIIDSLRNLSPPGKFLKYDSTTELWYELDHENALAKTKQALREGATELLYNLQIKTRLEYELDHKKSLLKAQPHCGMVREGTQESQNKHENQMDASKAQAQMHETIDLLEIVSCLQL